MSIHVLRTQLAFFQVLSRVFTVTSVLHRPTRYASSHTHQTQHLDVEVPEDENKENDVYFQGAAQHSSVSNLTDAGLVGLVIAISLGILNLQTRIIDHARQS